jgi:drug/metabolite transporter (DMT)-like permease
MSGVIWAILSGLGFGFFQLFNRRAGRHLQLYQGTFLLLLISTGILLLTSLAFEDLSLLAHAPASTFVYFALAGLIHFFLGWTLLTASQNRVGAARTGALIGTAPLFGTLIGFLFLGEFLNLLTIAGVLLVVAGVYLVSNG